MAFGVMACWVVSLSRTFANAPVHHSPGKSSANDSGKATTPVGKSKDAAAASTAALGGADRYLTFVSTDKPIYHPGEKVYVRGVVLNAADHKPLAAGQDANPTIQIKGSRGDVLASATARAQDSVWGYMWDVPQGQAGGEYTVAVTYPWEGHAPAERKFDVRNFRAPRLKSQITFLRDGYGPGEKVTATLDVKRAEGGVPQGAKVTVVARIDGDEVDGGTGTVDDKGLCTVSFDLPRQIERGEGTLSLVIADGGVVETAAKTIPILLQTVDLQVYPEGGDLIAGFKNRVYVQAHQPNGKPADLEGKLMCKQGAQTDCVANFKTEHEGRGRFEFTPEADKDYYLTVSAPAGIKTKYPLPKIKASGAVIHSDADVFKKNQAVTVKVGCTEKNFLVTLAKREVEVASDKIKRATTASMQTASFDVPPNIDGVLTVTVWSEKGSPLAERLIFREPANPLNITITPDKKAYIPGGKAKLTVKATNADGKPVSTMVGLTVTDDSVLELVEKREKAPRLPVMLFLEPEVTDLADAGVYLDPTNPKAPMATDLLLGTQGWRRFATMDLSKFVESYGDNARRALAVKTASAVANRGFEDMMIFEGAVLKRGGFMPPAPAPLPQSIAANKNELIQPQAQKAAADREKARDMPVAEPVAAPLPASKQEEVAWAVGRESNQFAGKKMAAMEMDFRRARIAPAPVFVREFAHQVRADRKPNDRVDFAETLYWNCAAKTDAKTGEATVEFGLNDSVTTFRVLADAFTSDGAVGAASLGMESVQPFYVEAKMPLEVTEGDHILLPISLVNATTERVIH
ncbi:MAG: hypothetical protein HYX67_10520 [Candidatus Melainabacteria bacterium]|nr:hypothetical protein [Candidatus Melainabacteria bacterium]